MNTVTTRWTKYDTSSPLSPPREQVQNGLVPAPRPLTVLIPGSHRVPPFVPTQRKVLSMPKTFAGSRRPLTGHQRVHRSLNAPLCALTVFHRPHEIYHTVGLAGTMWQLHNALPYYLYLPGWGLKIINGGDYLWIVEYILVPLYFQHYRRYQALTY